MAGGEYNLEELFKLLKAEANAAPYITEAFEDSQIRTELNQAIDSKSLTFSDAVSKCSVCQGIPRQPTSLRECGHIGCESCLMQVLVTHNNSQLPIGSAQCPTCRIVYQARSLVPFVAWPLMQQQTWKMIRVKCGKALCDYVKDPVRVVEHEHSECEHRIVRCPCEMCRFYGSFREVRTHTETCQYLYIYCTKCAFLINYVRRAEHDCIKSLTRHIESKHRKPLQTCIINQHFVEICV